MAHLKAKKTCPTQAPFAFLETGFVFVSLFLLKLVQRFHNRIERFVLTGESQTERPATPIEFSPQRWSTCVGVITRRTGSIGIPRCSMSNNGQTGASKPVRFAPRLGIDYSQSQKMKTEVKNRQRLYTRAQTHDRTPTKPSKIK